MKVAFRTDASFEIGIGHAMRCLTLANALAGTGAQCSFLCRELAGNLITHIRAQGHWVYGLPTSAELDADLRHSSWLGATQLQDAEACKPILAQVRPDWIIVDHYALDRRWETSLSEYCSGKLMAVDDLADRPHSCRVLLDQTVGRTREDYHSLVPDESILLCGPSHALLRPEFVRLRAYSLKRREQAGLGSLLVNMGGVDRYNLPAHVLKVLRSSSLPADCKITVVLGTTAPGLSEVQQQAKSMPFSTSVVAGVENMAQLMADSDLAIGAAGVSSLERCCLGLPSLILSLAENQTAMAAGLASTGAARLVDFNDESIWHIADVITEICSSAHDLSQMSRAASRIVNGEGLRNIIEILGA